MRKDYNASRVVELFSFPPENKQKGRNLNQFQTLGTPRCAGDHRKSALLQIPGCLTAHVGRKRTARS